MKHVINEYKQVADYENVEKLDEISNFHTTSLMQLPMDRKKHQCNMSIDSGINCDDEHSTHLSFNSDSDLSENESCAHSKITNSNGNRQLSSSQYMRKPPSIRPPPPPSCTFSIFKQRQRKHIMSKDCEIACGQKELYNGLLSSKSSDDHVCSNEDIPNADNKHSAIDNDSIQYFSEDSYPKVKRDHFFDNSKSISEARFMLDSLPKSKLPVKYEKYNSADEDETSIDMKPVVMKAKKCISSPLRRRRQTKKAKSPSCESELLQLANPMQLELIKSKKKIEKDLGLRLERTMETSDNLLGAIRKSMSEVRTKDRVECANKEINNVIKTKTLFDEKTQKKMYAISIDLGKYMSNVMTERNDSKIKIISSTEETPVFTKTMELQLPTFLDINYLEIIQIENIMTITAPYSTYETTKTVCQLNPELIEKDPSDWRNRVSFLQNLFQSLDMQWPPEGAGAHFEYLLGEYDLENPH